MVTDTGSTPQRQSAQFGVLRFDFYRNCFADTLFAVLNHGLQRRKYGKRVIHPDDIPVAITAAIT